MPVSTLPAPMWGHAEAWQTLSWSWEPWVLAAAIGGCGIYAVAAIRMRQAGKPHLLGRWRLASFAAAMGIFLLIFASPLDALADQLFSAHMAQHMLLMLVLPPLVLCARPGMAAAWLVSPARRKHLATGWHRHWSHLQHRLLMPATVWVANTAALWFWHMPAPYELALRKPALHALEHLSLLLAALAFWQLTLRSGGTRRLSHGAIMLFTATQAVQSGLLGAVLTFAGQPLYASHLGSTQAFGLSPLEDQQLAGLLMWLPGSNLYLVLMVIGFVQWMQAAERRQRAQPLASACIDQQL